MYLKENEASLDFVFLCNAFIVFSFVTEPPLSTP